MMRNPCVAHSFCFQTNYNHNSFHDVCVRFYELKKLDDRDVFIRSRHTWMFPSSLLFSFPSLKHFENRKIFSSRNISWCPEEFLNRKLTNQTVKRVSNHFTLSFHRKSFPLIWPSTLVVIHSSVIIFALFWQSLSFRQLYVAPQMTCHQKFSVSVFALDGKVSLIIMVVIGKWLKLSAGKKWKEKLDVTSMKQATNIYSLKLFYSFDPLNVATIVTCF